MDFSIIFLIISAIFVSLDVDADDATSERSCLHGDNQQYCSADRYILYDVNPPEGFNLRRDVYMRLAIFMRKIKNTKKSWKLVLPPWNYLPHWRSVDIGLQEFLPWGLFFDVNSLAKYSPVIELYDFLEGIEEYIVFDWSITGLLTGVVFLENKGRPIDHVVILQHYADAWTEGFVWENKWSFEKCLQPHNYKKDENVYRPIFGLDELTSKSVKCASFQGYSSMLQEIITHLDGRTVLFEHAEIVLHENYGDFNFWQCRRSMKFAPNLVKAANKYMTTVLNTTIPLTKIKGYAGGPYLCVHLRRRDFLSRVPTLKEAARQIMRKLHSGLSTVFVATDSSTSEYEEMKELLTPFHVVKYNPNYEERFKYKDGGIAIIEQIICSHSRYFIGTHDSTFSFRIQEEREILGLHADTTFNSLCASEEPCEQPTKWLISN